MNEKVNVLDIGDIADDFSSIAGELTESAYEQFTMGYITSAELQTIYNHLRQLNKYYLRKLNKTQQKLTKHRKY